VPEPARAPRLVALLVDAAPGQVLGALQRLLVVALRHGVAWDEGLTLMGRETRAKHRDVTTHLETMKIDYRSETALHFA
jgi:hypothetical protein